MTTTSVMILTTTSECYDYNSVIRLHVAVFPPKRGRGVLSFFEVVKSRKQICLNQLCFDLSPVMLLSFSYALIFQLCFDLSKLCFDLSQLCSYLSVML